MRLIKHGIKHILGIVVLLSLLSAEAWAQPPVPTLLPLPSPVIAVTPSPTALPIATTPASPPVDSADVMIIAETELASVQVFRAKFVLNLPLSAFERITLSVSQTGWAGSDTTTVDVGAIATITEGYTEFVHLWTVDPANPPRL
ncbi:MAG: hypothetical protein H7Y11_09815, partial [Armatimonadetes bacterium]|nr:hypothetical protein [Anaerolineae bacterium]